jgi:nicotinamidase-related amidase
MPLLQSTRSPPIESPGTAMASGDSRPVARIDRDRALLLVVDVQERLAPHVRDHEALIARCDALLQAAARFSIPRLATEHAPDRIGALVPALREQLDARSIFRKTRFSAADHAEFVALMHGTGRTQIVIAGMEAHVCVMQTALGLHACGFDMFVVADAVGSRTTRLLDRRHALERLRASDCTLAGTETVLFEWAHDANDPGFEATLALVKALPDNAGMS